MLINDFTLNSELKKELLPDEKLLWAGTPKKGILFRSSDAFVIPFSIFWFGFAIFWESSVVSGEAPFFFMLWGIPFLAMGLYITVGRFFYDKFNRDKTVYAVTDKRVIIKSGVFKKNVQSFNIKILFNLSINEKSDGSGTIKLDSDNASGFQQGIVITGWPGTKQVPALEFIPEARTVYNLILKQQSN